MAVVTADCHTLYVLTFLVVVCVFASCSINCCQVSSFDLLLFDDIRFLSSPTNSVASVLAMPGLLSFHSFFDDFSNQLCCYFFVFCCCNVAGFFLYTTLNISSLFWCFRGRSLFLVFKCLMFSKLLFCIEH